MRNDRRKARDDWARRPSAMFASVALGITSLTMMGFALSRDLVREPAPAIVVKQDARVEEQVEPTSRRSSAIRLIDVNTATLSELDLLPGIGPALGQRIIDYRDMHGAFGAVDELTQVSGIGPRTLEKIRPLVTIDAEGGYTTDN